VIALSDIPTGVYKALLILATVIWGYSFVVMKNVVEVVPPALLLGVRFTLAGLLLLAILHKRVKKHFSWNMVACGAILALFDFSAFLTQTIGLQYTTPGINAFLTATYCVIVPFAWWVVAHKRPSICNVGAAVIAVVGIWLVAVTTSGETLTLGLGEGLTQICALLFALHIVLVSRFSKTRDVLVLTVFQFIFEGFFGLCVGAAFETPPALSLITPEVVGQMAFLIVFASVVAFGIQNVSLAYVPPAQASLFLSLESVFGVIFSVLLYGEVVTARLLVGFTLIFIAILVNELLAPRLEAKRAIVAFKRKKWKEDEGNV
jgi:drug/metabolite transporter (DMT)-like permease